MSHFRSVVSSFAVAAALVASPAVFAQSEGGSTSSTSSSGLGAGTLGFGGSILGNGGGMIQGSYFLTPNGALRLGLDLNLQGANGNTTVTVGISGGYRFYFGRTGAVAPFAEPGLRLTINPGGAPGFGLGLYGGIGAEYFFTQQFAVGVMGSLNVGFNSTDNATSVGLSTATSSFFATFYW